MANDTKSGSRKINQNIELAPGARDLTTTGDITAGYFYGDGSNLTGISTAGANDALITITAGAGLTGGGGFTVDQAADAVITVSHSDTSSQASVSNSTFNVIQSITLDTYGHITAMSSQDIGTAGFYIKTTGEVGVGQKIGLGSLTYQTVQFFAGTGLSVVRTDNEIQFSAPNATQWNTAYTYSQVGHLPLAGGTLTGALTINADDGVKATYNVNDGDAWLRGWGIESNRGAVYLRPTTNNAQTLNIGYSEGNLNWGTVSVDATSFDFNGNAIIHAGNIGSQSVNYATTATTANNALALSGYALDGATSVATRIFNNKGQAHGTYTDFNTAMTPGPNYLQGGTNGPTGTTSQWYGFMLGLGGEYNTETGNASGYGSQLYWNRQSSAGFPYLYARDLEAGTWGSWRKMSAGYADTAGSASSVAWDNISSKPSLWYQSGSWYADFASYSFVRENGVTMTGGSEFTLMSRSGQGHVLIDGSYWAGEGSGFYSLNNSNQYTSQVGFARDSNAFAAFNTTVSAVNDVRAPIFYDSNDTTYYLNPNSGGVSLKTAGNIISNGGFGTNGYGSGNLVGRVYGPKGATYSSGAFSVTGAIKIKLPIRSNDTMWSMKVRIYNYSSNATSEYLIGNYSYSAGAWNHAATYFGSASSAALTVRFGNEGGYDCVWIGETSTGWAHPVVSVMDFMGGYSNGYAETWDDNWDITFVTSFGTIGASISPDIKFSTGEATSSFRAPIFYDSNDTSYYIDGASESQLAKLKLINATSGYDLMLGPYTLSRTHNDSDRHGIVINADLYPHIDLNATTSSDNDVTHGATISMTGKLGAGFRRWGMGIAQYNPNELSFGYHDNQANPHYGVGINWSYPAKMWIDTAGDLYSTGSMRSPIFYDSNNTGYYVNPASQSNVDDFRAAAYRGNANVGGTGTASWHPDGIYCGSTMWQYGAQYKNNTGIYDLGEIKFTNGPYIQKYNSRSVIIRAHDSSDCGISGRKSDGGFAFQIYGQGSEYGFLGYEWGDWDIRKIPDGRMYLNNNNDYYLQTNDESYVYRMTSASDARAPLFYDQNDTNYYVDPNGISRLLGIAIRGDADYTGTSNQITFWGAGGSTTSAIGFKSNGGYFPNPTGSGDGYNTYLTMDTSGRGWVFRQGVGGSDFGAAYTSGWILNNGIWQANSSMRAPIFYDSNNTAHYIDAAGGSNIRNLYVGDAGSSWSDPGGWGTQFHVSNGPHSIIRVYARNESIQTGMYSHVGGLSKAGSLSNHDFRIIRNDSDRMYFYSGYTYSSGYLEAADSLRAPIFYDSNNTTYYVNPNETSSIHELYLTGAINYNGSVAADSGYGLYFGSSRDSAYGIFRESGAWSPPFPDLRIAFHTGIKLGANANYNGIRFYTDYDMATQVMSVNNSSDGYGAGHVHVNNIMHAGGSVRAPIFYDSNDTTYYLDPAGNGTRAAFLNGNVWISPKPESYGEGIAFLMPSQSTWGGLRWLRGVSTFTGAWAFGYFGNEANDNIGFHSGGVNGWRLDHSWNMTSIGSVRSPIFYDSDNTGYYADPASTSNLNVVAGTRFIAGYDPGVANSFSCSDWFRSSGASGWYNGTYAGGIYMTDSTWVRTYNDRAFFTASTLAAGGDVIAYYSDERLKDKKGGIENPIEKVKSLNAFYYTNNEIAKQNGFKKEDLQIGLSAQEVQKIAPEIVTLAPFDMETLEDGEIVSKSGENYLTLNYAKLVPILVEAIKEQQLQIEELKAIVNGLTK